MNGRKTVSTTPKNHSQTSESGDSREGTLNLEDVTTRDYRMIPFTLIQMKECRRFIMSVDLATFKLNLRSLLKDLMLLLLIIIFNQKRGFIQERQI
jgi:hypothetical protein